MVCETLFLNASTIDKQGVQYSNQAIAIADARIVWCGEMSALPEAYRQSPTTRIDCKGMLVTPGLIDCHTHLVYAGHRAQEFEKRLEGMSYAELAKRGGGILSTVKQTRAASEASLLEQSLPRLLALRAEGVTTVEIKSGYGLDLVNELKLLRVARCLGEMTGVRIKTTFLGAHAIPPEYQGKSQAYVDYLCAEVLPSVVDAGLVDALDVFSESIGFSLAETEQLFRAAEILQLPIKCHAEQLSNIGASRLAASFYALSCDHLEHLDAIGVDAMAKSHTVAVLLPGAYYFLGETKRPPIDLLRKAGVGMAIATDSNPGSSPTTSLLLMMSMACRFFSLTVPEALGAVTYQAARALGIEDQTGTIAVGMAADLVRWSIHDGAELCYYVGSAIPHDTMIAGQWVK